MTEADMERFSEGINNTVQSVVPRLKDFHQLLLLPPKVVYSEILCIRDVTISATCISVSKRFHFSRFLMDWA